jgi:glycosyltransferase involved in cell wall biosynthesis
MKAIIPDISVIVPVYKVEAYIGRCAKSLFEQEAGNVEYIFVNDCTPDNSMEVLQQTMALYPHRVPQVKIIHHETNKGVSAARNAGLRAVEGKIVCFVDGDDFVNPGYLGSFIDGSATADCCVCGYVVNGVSYSLSDRVYGKGELGRCVYELEEAGLLGVVWNKCFRVEVIKRNNLWFDETVKFWEDRMFVLDYLLVAESVAMSAEGIFYNYESRSDSAVKQSISLASVMGYLHALDRLLLRLRGTEDLLRVCQQAFIYIALCVNSVYVGLRVSRKDRLSLLREVDRVMGNCPQRFSEKQLANFKIVFMYRVLLFKSVQGRDCLLRIMGGLRKIEVKLSMQRSRYKDRR